MNRDNEPFQMRVRRWVVTAFGFEIADNQAERGHRFLEEAIELAQAVGTSREDAHALVDYTYGRPIGEPGQEVGGVMITLAGLCAAIGINLDAEAERELSRVWTKIDAIRAKQAAKPKAGPLPELSSTGRYGMAWSFPVRVGDETKTCAGKTDGGMYPWDREHAEAMIEQMNRIYGPGTHWVIAA